MYMLGVLCLEFCRLSFPQLSECQMEKLSCPHCSQKLGQKEGRDPSSDVLFSHLRAVWNSQVATPTNGSPSRASRSGPTWT